MEVSVPSESKLPWALDQKEEGKEEMKGWREGGIVREEGRIIR